MGSEVPLICTENSIQKIMILPEYVRLCEGGPQGKVTQLFDDVLHSAPVNTLMTEGTYIIVVRVCRSLKVAHFLKEV
jgi:hypothetical protein